MAMLDLLEERLQLAAEPLGEPEPVDLRDFVGRQPQQSEVAGALEEFANRAVTPKDQIPAVLDLLERVVTTEVDRGAIALGELRPDGPGPVLEALANDGRTEAVGGRLQGGRIGRGQKRIVVFAKVEAEAEEFRSMK